MYEAGCARIRVRVQIIGPVFDNFVSKADRLGDARTYSFSCWLYDAPISASPEDHIYAAIIFCRGFTRCGCQLDAVLTPTLMML